MYFLVAELLLRFLVKYRSDPNEHWIPISTVVALGLVQFDVDDDMDTSISMDLLSARSEPRLEEELEEDVQLELDDKLLVMKVASSSLLPQRPWTVSVEFEF